MKPTGYGKRLLLEGLLFYSVGLVTVFPQQITGKGTSRNKQDLTSHSALTGGTGTGELHNIFTRTSRATGEDTVVRAILSVTPPTDIDPDLTPFLAIPNVVEAPNVRLRNGWVSGGHVILQSRPDTDISLPGIFKYLGIPYATAPIENLRFSAPQYPAPDWEGIRNGTMFGAVCPQKIPEIPEGSEEPFPAWKRKPIEDTRPFLERAMSEDCLFLNVYVPIRERREQRYSVLVYIHGDGFSEGNGNMYDGSVLASHGDIIVVTFNYRIGILGFLSTGNSSLPGNYGLLDQIAALRWVQDNIAAFGGDPSNVTIMGTGTGAACAGLLMMSDLTRGLFRGVIAESGSPLASWSINKEPMRYFNLVKQETGCTDTSQETALDCLRRIPIHQFLQLNIRSPLFFYAFAPVVDKHVVRAEPKKMVADILVGNWNVTGVSYLTGLTKSEGFSFVGDDIDYIGKIKSEEVFDRTFNGFVQNNFGGTLKSSSIIKDTILFEYTEYEAGDKNPYAAATALLDIISDHQWVTPAIETVKFLDRLGAATYLYLFTHRPKMSPYPRWAGPVHLDELPFIFGAPLVQNSLGVFRDNYTKHVDPHISMKMVTYWSNFVKSGNPNEPISMTDITDTLARNNPDLGDDLTSPWPAYSVKKQEIIYITARSRLRDYYRVHKTMLWEELIPKIESKMFTDETTVRNIPRDPNVIVEVLQTSSLAPAAGSTSLTAGSASTESGDDKTYVIEHTKGGITDSFGTNGFMVELSMVIAIGGFLLLLNLLVLGFIYYLRDKKKIEAKLAAKYLAHLEEERKRKESTSKGFMQTTPDSGIGISSLLSAQSNGRSGTFGHGSVSHSRDSTIRINADGDIEFEV